MTAAIPPAANWVAAASRFALQVAAAGVAGISAVVIYERAATKVQSRSQTDQALRDWAIADIKKITGKPQRNPCLSLI